VVFCVFRVCVSGKRRKSFTFARSYCFESVAKASDNYGEIVVMQAALASHETKLKNCEENSLILGEKYDSLENKLNSLKKFDKLNDIINQNQNAIQNVENKIDNVLNSETLISLPENVQVIQNNLKDHEENVKGITNKISKLEKSLGEENIKSMASMDTKISELEESLGKENKNSMASMNTKISELEESLGKENKNSMANMNTKISKLEESLGKENKNSMASMNTKISKLEESLGKENKNSMASMNTKISILEESLGKENKNSMASMNIKISKLEESLGKEKKKSMANMNTKISKSLEDLESKLKKDQNKLMQKYSNNFENKIDVLQKQLVTNNAKVLEQANIIKDLSEKYDSTKQKLEELQAGAEEGFGSSFFAQLTELKEVIVDSYSHVMHDLLIRMGFDPNNLEETGRQLKNYCTVGYEKCQEFVEHSKVYGSQGVELLSVWSGHGFIYYNLLVEKIPVWTEGLMEQAQFYGELLREHGSGCASVIGQKASEFGQLAAEKAKEISLEDIKQSSISVAEQAQTNYYTGKDYVRDTFPQVKQVFEGTRTQFTQLGVDDPANVELILDLTIICSLLLVFYLSLKGLCCLFCGCRRKGKKKKASPSVLKKVEKARKENKAKANAKKKDGEEKGKKGKRIKKKS